VGLLTMTGGLVEPYAKYAYVTDPGSLPAPLVADWIEGWIWMPTIVLMCVFPLLLFPTGRTLSPRWRPVAWLAAATTAGYAMFDALSPTLKLADGRTVANPTGVAAIGDVDETLDTVLTSLILLLLLAAVGSLVVRFRRSHGTERQQLKWFTYAGALVLLSPLGGFLLPRLGNLPFVVVVALPIAVGIAIPRYRLYEIDRLINRTLVYGLLTVSLGLLYAGAVLVLGQLFGGIGAEPPSWAVAGSTLAVAALFQPARRRFSRWWTGASTGAATTRPRPSSGSAPDFVTRSTWTCCRPSCLGLWIRRCSRRRCGCGFDRPPMAPRAPLAVRQMLPSPPSERDSPPQPTANKRSPCKSTSETDHQ
jgi:hypothetical protein